MFALKITDKGTHLLSIVHDGPVGAELAHLGNGVDTLLDPRLCVQEGLVDNHLSGKICVKL